MLVSRLISTPSAGLFSLVRWRSNNRYNAIGALGAAVCADALRSNHTLLRLNLRGNDLGPEGAAMLADALETNCTISALDLGSNR